MPVLNNECHHCGNYIEFPEHGVGEEIRCPHCGLTVVLSPGARTTAPQPAKGFEPAVGQHASHARGTDFAHELGLDREVPPAAQPIGRQRALKIGRPALLAIAGAALAILALLLVLWLRPSYPMDTPAEHAEAISRVEVDARLAGAPTGLGEAKWLMTSENVMNLAPEIKQLSPGVLSEKKKVYAREAEVTYHFSEDELLLITVTFAGPSSPADFDQIQTRLAAEYGPMPAPAPAGGYTLASVKRIRHFVIEHGLVEAPGGPVEKLLFYAGQAGHPTNMPPVKVSR